MDSDRYTQLSLNLTVKRTHPELLAGLEVWLQLGLISDAKVRAFCQQNLTCRRPRAVSRGASPESTHPSKTSLVKSNPTPALQPSLQQDRDQQPQVPTLQSSPQRDEQPPRLTPQPSQKHKSDWLAQLLQSLMTELNVLWLMLLGVFMVVVSSGVLAATRWRYLTPAGQYGLLFAYTLVFAAVAYDLSRRPKLQLTARMLQATALILIPVNFWMMDQVNLFRSGAGWLVGVSAAFSLTVMMVVLLTLQRGARSSPFWARLNAINSLGLSWLHWGWGHSGWPGFAIHSGMVVTGLIVIYQDFKWGDRPPRSTQTADLPASALWGGLQPSRIAVVGGLLVLLFRVIVVTRVPLSQVSGAIALAGFLLCWLGRRAAPNAWFGLGIGLLLLGRGASLPAVFAVQALIISGLALVMVGERLYRRSQVVDLVCLLGLGLQTLLPLRQLASEQLQQQVVAIARQFAPSDVGMPIVLWGVGLFPYCLFTLWLGSKLRQRRSGELTQVAEGLALGFGCCLTALSCVNPLTRALNLVLSALTLGVAIGRRPHAHPTLLYLTQIAGLAALFTTLDLMWPNLSLALWALLFLVAMIGEWGVSGWGQTSRWQESAWHLGLVLAAISYVLWSSQAIPGRVLWLITPLMLTGLGDRAQGQRSRWAATLSLLALILAQPLTFPWTLTRFVGLGVSIALMVMNTRMLQGAIAGGVTIGFVLAFLCNAFWELPQASVGLFLGSVASTTLLLWFLQDQVRRYAWGRWYIKGLNGWAWTLNSLNLLVVSLGLGWVYGRGIVLTGSEFNLYHLIGAMGVATLAIAYHHWRHPSEFSRFQVEWGVELWVASGLLLWETDLVKLAIANLVLAALSLGVDTLWVRRTRRAYRASDQWIPFLYGAWGMLLGHHQFTAVTGVYTLIFSLLVMGISRRNKGFRGLSFLALASLSWGLYELLTYQLLQAVGGSPAKGWLMFALLATVIAGCEYALAPGLAWLVNLSIRELKIIAHLHWLGANGLALLAFLEGLSPTAGLVWIGVVSGLAIYALIQGRRREDWIYAGLLNGIAAFSYGLYLSMPLSLLLQWGSALACLVAVGFYHLPWSAWGWAKRPWRQVALGLPLVVTATTATGIGLSSLLITGGLYAWLALQEQRPRISYLSLLLGGWAIWRLLGLYQLQGGFAIASLIGVSLLYFAQIEPHLQAATVRNQRHLVRSFATGLICLSALVESDAQFLWGLAAAGFFLALILLGLLLRVRAFAYMGTLFFGLKVMRQLWFFVADQSFLLWAIGIVFGLLLIWIAATFEARRSQVTALLSYWLDELQSWA
ncbi:MAG: hypothetical protein AAGG51_22130 [Cyanobacteria bacterium P01_G01_bin.54]